MGRVTLTRRVDGFLIIKIVTSEIKFNDDI